MADRQPLHELLDQLPDPDDRGMFTTDIDKEKIEAAVAALHQGGAENVRALIDLLGPPGSDQDVKPRYALHCLLNHTLVTKDDEARKAYCRVLADELGGDSPKHVQAFLCQELAWAGRAEVVPALGRLLTDETLSAPASMALVAIREGAAAAFQAAWPSATGAARRHIMDGLADLAEPASAAILREGLGDEDREVRIAAGAGLASLGQADDADALIRIADAAKGWERIQATKNCLVLAETLAARGDASAARRVYEHLQRARNAAAEGHIREAAERGLAALG